MAKDGFTTNKQVTDALRTLSKPFGQTQSLTTPSDHLLSMNAKLSAQKP